jgi:hypothetical protein
MTGNPACCGTNYYQAAATPENAVDDSTRTLITAGVGALVGGGLVILKDYLQGRWLRRADKERWVRDKLHEIYTNCIFYLSHKGIPNWIFSEYKNGKELEYSKIMLEGQRLEAELVAQRLKWLNLLIVHHPARGTPAFEDFVKKVQSKEIQAQDVVDLAASDPRLKSDYHE